MSEAIFPFKPNYKINLVGCDDSTEIEFFLDGHEVPLLMEIAEKINEAAYETCQPNMYVTEIE